MTADRGMRDKTLRLGVLAMLPALVGQPGSFAMAESVYKSHDFLNVAAKEGVGTSGLEPDRFIDRWRGRDSFMVSSSGEVIATYTSEASRETRLGVKQNDNLHSAVLPDEPKAITGHFVHQYGEARLELAEQPPPPPAGACGPSLLSQVEIRGLVVEAARRHLVDEDLAVAVATVESDLDQVRNSPQGARGAMQLMPETATRFGVVDPCDPETNIDGGIRYLRVLLEEFQNPLLALAAYNAGEGRIYEYGGIPPFPETVGFVAKVLNHQLGLPMPASAEGTTERDEAEAERVESGVIMTRSPGEWVGGVMHFQTGAIQ